LTLLKIVTNGIIYDLALIFAIIFTDQFL